jgi:ribosomal protein S12 methylthiotransferase accessory factor
MDEPPADLLHTDSKFGIRNSKLEGVLNWVDSRFGPIRDLLSLRLGPPEPEWWLVRCDLARAPAGTWHTHYPAGAAGTSVEREEAFDRVLGEALERYSGLNYVWGEKSFSLASLDSPMLKSFPRCAPEEPCPPAFRGLTPDVPLAHVWVERLSDSQRIPVPAAYVHLNFQPREVEPWITFPISTGLAFHPHLHQAIWTGLCEVAERDAIMVMWLNRRPLPVIVDDDSRLPFRLATRLERLQRVGLTPHLFDMSTDFRVPTVLCLLAGESFPYYVAAAACRADPAEACAKALDEAVSARISARRFASPNLVPSFQEFDWVRSLECHELLYAHWPATPALDFLMRPDRVCIPFTEFARQPWWPAPTGMDDVVARAAALDRIGLTVLWINVTTPEVREFGYVTKVVVPEMVPLTLDHNARWLATPRLHLWATGSKPPSFNPYPHPFA